MQFGESPFLFRNEVTPGKEFKTIEAFYAVFA